MPANGDCLTGRRWAVTFPSPEKAQPGGLLAWGGDLDPETLVSAYGQGIFPWYSEGDPILWWSPDPRCVLFPNNFHISRRSFRKIRHSQFLFSVDADFAGVIKACAEPRKGAPGTWLLPEMQAAYLRLHERNLAHSIEIWQNGRLVGGLYGVALARVFFGESMFHKTGEASRAAMCCLVRILNERGFLMLDCQQTSPHMLKMGACEISRQKFLEVLDSALADIWEKPESWGQQPTPL